ncbi:MAG: LamG-like jellyroll fold domain-containing protein, partial [Flavobacteriales bacterium]
MSFWFYANSISSVVSLYASDNPNLSNGMSAVNLSNTNGLDSIIIQQGFKRARASITTNEWHHVMLLHDGNLDEIYVDCVKLNTAQISVNKSINGLSTTVLGSNRNKMGFNFSGKIDDIRIYRGVISDARIK